MITFIQGVLVSASPLRAVIEAHGLGYEVSIPVTTAEKLPPAGATVKLHTLAIYREDAQTLCGFATEAERDFFRMMIDHVTGIGPKVALGIMSRLALPVLEAAIRAGDVALLARCPGIGKKTAERLVVELRSKVGAAGGASSALPGTASGDSSSVQSAPADATAALIALGYRAPDADAAVRRAALALGPAATTEALIKKALG